MNFWDDYQRLPEVRFFLHWWWLEAIVLVLFALMLVGIRRVLVATSAGRLSARDAILTDQNEEHPEIRLNLSASASGFCEPVRAFTDEQIRAAARAAQAVVKFDAAGDITNWAEVAEASMPEKNFISGRDLNTLFCVMARVPVPTYTPQPQGNRADRSWNRGPA